MSLPRDGAAGWGATIAAYASIARPDHWFKNVFMLLGVLLAFFYHPELLAGFDVGTCSSGAVAATCLIASSNYVHQRDPRRPDRPQPSRQAAPADPVGPGEAAARLRRVDRSWALSGLAHGLAAQPAVPLLAALFLLVMGMIYNVPPVRSKECPTSTCSRESVNNPIRLLLGWFVVTPRDGAAGVAAGRLLDDRGVLHGHQAVRRVPLDRRQGAAPPPTAVVPPLRRATAAGQHVLLHHRFALFLGVFIIRYHLELILIFPLIAGFVCYLPAHRVQAGQRGPGPRDGSIRRRA